ncbi:MAG TPA: Ig-like domain-containing protein, partial [Verrucomicrobiae bacterium]|nr:Ig-like domain-containing protein [Verrucomicrobiae bacterium]
MHWGLYTDTSVNRKASVAPQISNFTLVGSPSNFLTAYQYANNANGYTWYDGAPVATVTNTTTGVWAYQYTVAGLSDPLGSGFRLTVPADTTQKTLRVYVGAYSAEGQLTASLSDGSAASFTSSGSGTVNNFGLGPGGVFAITYAADSSNQTLTVTWKLVRVNGNPTAAPNVTLQAATLTSNNADNPPFVTITNPASDAAFAEGDTIAIKATAQDFDSSVTNVAFYAGTNLLGQSATSPYSVDWSKPVRGYYTLTARATDDTGTAG